MTIQIGEIMIPCRQCGARPGEDCHRVKREPIPHKKRVRDALKTSELLDW